MLPTFEFISNNTESTSSFGTALGRFMLKGQVVALSGELGAGKTTLIKAICKGAGIPDDIVVSSPSYTLVNEYDGKIPVYHFDFYRLEGAKDIHELGYDEYLDGDGISLVEWADIAPEIIPPEHLELKIDIRGESERKLTLTARGKSYEKIVDSLLAWKEKNNL